MFLGVEFAAELRDLVREDLKHLYPHLIDYCKVTLVEALPQILNAYDENVRNISAYKQSVVDNIRLSFQTHPVNFLNLLLKLGQVLISSLRSKSIQQIILKKMVSIFGQNTWLQKLKKTV